MNAKLSMIAIKSKMSWRSMVWLFKKPRYVGLAAFIAVLFFELMYWLFNYEVLWVILKSSKVSLLEKIDVLLSPIEAIGGTSGTRIVVMMMILSILQGISIAALTYVIKNQKKVDSKLLGGSSFVGILAIIGLGCPACGTSLLTPVIAIFASSSAVAISETITNIALPVAMLISIYGLYVLGQRLATSRAQQDLT